MSDQKDECIIATEVSARIQVYVVRISLSVLVEASKILTSALSSGVILV